MFDTVHALPGMPLAVLQTLLTRLPARAVALVVSSGEDHPALLRDGALEALAMLAQQEGKVVTLVGGTGTLRARAVFAGLMAATSVEDWRAACRSRDADQPLLSRNPPTPTDHPYLWVLTPTPGAENTDDQDAPPAYLRALLPGNDTPIIDESANEDERESFHLRLLRESERYEEEITRRILASAESTAREHLRESRAEGAGASGSRLARSPWTRPLNPLVDEAEGARSS